MSSPSPIPLAAVMRTFSIYSQVKLPIEFLPTSFYTPLHIFSSMSKATSPPADVERGNRTSGFPASPLSSLSLSARIVGDPTDLPQPIRNQPLGGEPSTDDSSGPLFSMYSKMAEEEDNKMVERWERDANGILVFVSF